MADTRWWEKATTVAAVATLALVVLGGVWNLVDEDELKATEDRITSAIRDSTAQTNAQMQELRGYIVNHLNEHANSGDPTN